MRIEDAQLGLTYKDVLLVPLKSNIASRKSVDTSSMLTKKIRLNVPIVSANMDTVTESSMAIAMASLGGIGIIHRFMDAEREAREVMKVKRAAAHVIEKPYTAGIDTTVGSAKEAMYEMDVSGILIIDDGNKLLGLVSKRDVKFHRNDSDPVGKVMTPREKLVVANMDVDMEKAAELLHKYRIEKLLK